MKMTYKDLFCGSPLPVKLKDRESNLRCKVFCKKIRLDLHKTPSGRSL